MVKSLHLRRKCLLQLELDRFFFSVITVYFFCPCFTSTFSLWSPCTFSEVIITCQKVNLLYSTLAKSQHFEPRISQFQAVRESSEHLVLGFFKSFRGDLYWFWLFWRWCRLIDFQSSAVARHSNTRMTCVSGAFSNECIRYTMK